MLYLVFPCAAPARTPAAGVIQELRKCRLAPTVWCQSRHLKGWLGISKQISWHSRTGVIRRPHSSDLPDAATLDVNPDRSIGDMPQRTECASSSPTASATLSNVYLHVLTTVAGRCACLVLLALGSLHLRCGGGAAAASVRPTSTEAAVARILEPLSHSIGTDLCVGAAVAWADAPRLQFTASVPASRSGDPGPLTQPPAWPSSGPSSLEFDFDGDRLPAPASADTPAAPLRSSILDDADLYPSEKAACLLFEAATRSVVNVTYVRSSQNFGTLDMHKLPYRQGSGFVWDRQGHVVTNFHLVKGATEVKVTLSDHTTHTARVVGADPHKDVAVLKLALPKHAAANLQPLPLGSSSALRVGQNVYAVGNPFGLDHVMAKGIVSALGRELSTGLFTIRNVIVTDAAVGPASSGGVLLDSKGRVVGINLEFVDGSGRAGGGACSRAGAALPIDSVRGVVSHILAYTHVLRPTLGVSLAPPQVLAQRGMEGVLVLDVPEGGAAHAAGLRPTYRDVFGDLVLGDVLVSLDGAPLRSARDLYDALDQRRAGDRVRVEIVREGKRMSVVVALAERTLGNMDE